MTPELLRENLVAVLSAAEGPLATSAARRGINDRRDSRCRPLVVEEIYRALLILERRGMVRRVRNQPGRQAYWQLTPDYRRDLGAHPRASGTDQEDTTGE